MSIGATTVQADITLKKMTDLKSKNPSTELPVGIVELIVQF